MSRFPSLGIDMFEREVYFTCEPITDDIKKFVESIAKHAESGSWLTVNDIDTKESVVYLFDGNGSYTSEQFTYDREDEPDEFIPDDIESMDISPIDDGVLPSDGDKGEYI